MSRISFRGSRQKWNVCNNNATILKRLWAYGIRPSKSGETVEYYLWLQYYGLETIIAIT